MAIYYIQVKDANFIIYVFDVTNKESFENVKLWKDIVREHLTNKKCIGMLIFINCFRDYSWK